MKVSKKIKIILLNLVTFLFVFFAVNAATNMPVCAENSISSFNDLVNAIANAKDYEHTDICIGDLALPQFKPVAIDITNKNITIKSSKDYSTISSSTLGCIMIAASKTDTQSCIKFENIQFKTQNANVIPDSNANYSSTMQYAFGFSQGNIDATFSDCSFEGYQYDKGSGACISCVYSTASMENQTLRLNIDGCMFKNNVSNSGAIYISGSENVTANISNCYFVNNMGARGGSIFASRATLNIENCTFENNKDYALKTLSEGTTRGGGAIYAISSKVNIEKCNIKNNEHHNGSAIMFMNCNAVVSNSKIFNNKATNGSVLYVENSPYHLVTIINNTFNNNQSTGKKYFSINKKEENNNTLPQEIKTKIIMNSFCNNTGELQNVLDDERVTLFANLFVDNQYTQIGTENNYYTTFMSVENFNSLTDGDVESNTQVSLKKEEYKLDNNLVKNNVAFMYDSVYGNFYSGSNGYEKIILNVKNGKNIKNIEFSDKKDIKIENKNIFGYNFDGFNNFNLTNALISFDTTNEIIEPIYSLNIQGVLVFIALPIMVGVGITLVIVITKKKKMATVGNEQIIETEEITNPPLKYNVSWVENVTQKSQIKDILSEREMEVFVKLMEGKSRKTCAQELFITESTVKKHSANIYKKFQVKNRLELISKINKM